MKVTLLDEDGQPYEVEGAEALGAIFVWALMIGALIFFLLSWQPPLICYCPPMKKETKGQKSRTGTSHFESYHAAQTYYGGDIEIEVREGNISIGPPPIKEGQTLTIDLDGRYWIIE